MRYLYLLLLLFLTACTIDNAVRAANTAADIGDKTETFMATAYKAEQVAAIDSAATQVEGKVSLEKIRARWRTAWLAYEAFRKAWLVLADTINQAKAGKEVDLTTALLSLLEAESFLVRGIP